MKYLLFALLVFAFAHAAQALDLSISYCVFRSGSEPYVEVYLHISGSSVTFTPTPDSSFHAGVEVLLFFEKEAQIVRYDKFALHSPRMRAPGDFIDLKRYALSPGAYTLEVEMRDLNSPDNVKTTSIPVDIPSDAERMIQSDIQLLATAYKDSSDSPFCKSGLFLEPLAHHSYGKNASLLIFYHEVYDTDKVIGDDFLVSYRIDTDGGQGPRTAMIAHKRRSPEPVIPLLIQMDISQLPSGNYRLHVEVRNRMQELLSHKETAFRRDNPYLRPNPIDLAKVNLDEEFVAALSAEELRYSLRALTPKLAGKEQEALNLLIKSDSLPAQRRYLFNFWVGQSPNAPELAYRQYMRVVQSVDKTFISGFRRGFETDRGYTYLKYGPPDDMETREQEPSAPPYEIWSYYHFPATRQNNVKFIFYNPSLTPGDFILLHSDAIGERQNPQWIRDLYRHAPAEWQGNPIDGNDIQDNFNRNAKRVLRDN